jgi:hypothetical protein
MIIKLKVKGRRIAPTQKQSETILKGIDSKKPSQSSPMIISWTIPSPNTMSETPTLKRTVTARTHATIIKP